MVKDGCKMVGVVYDLFLFYLASYVQRCAVLDKVLILSCGELWHFVQGVTTPFNKIEAFGLAIN